MFMNDCSTPKEIFILILALLLNKHGPRTDAMYRDNQRYEPAADSSAALHVGSYHYVQHQFDGQKLFYHLSKSPDKVRKSHKKIKETSNQCALIFRERLKKGIMLQISHRPRTMKKLYQLNVCSLVISDLVMSTSECNIGQYLGHSKDKGFVARHCLETSAPLPPPYIFIRINWTSSK